MYTGFGTPDIGVIVDVRGYKEGHMKRISHHREDVPWVGRFEDSYDR